MSEIKKQAELASKKLLLSDTDQLYVDLGARIKAIEKDPSLAGSFDPKFEYDETQMGILDDVRDFGKRLLDRVMYSANELICGTGSEHKKERGQIVEAFGLGSTAVTTAIALGLVSGIGMAPAIAAVVAALIVKLFFKNVYAEFCASWKPEKPKEKPKTKKKKQGK